MAYEMRPETGSLFKNDKKTEDKHPNMTGTALIDGVEYWVSAWTKEGAKGRWQSLAFKRKDAAAPRVPQEQKRPMDDMADEIPFASCSLGDDVIFKNLRWPLE